MAAVTWDPDPATPLFSEFESALGPFSWTITATVEADGEGGGASPTIEGYSGTIDPDQDLLTVTGGENALTVTAETLNGLFPIVFIDYLTENDVLERIDDWDDLPAGARDLVEFRPDDSRRMVFTLTAEVELSNGDTETAEYDMIILHDWTPGRDRLVTEVNARRRS